MPYQLVYDLDLAKVSKDIVYAVDNRGKIKQPFDRIAYFLELTTDNGTQQNLYVSMDAFTDDLGKIGVPTMGSGAFFQQNVANMNVYSNVSGIVTGLGLKGGNIEFWPSNYGQRNSVNVPDASNENYDFGDEPAGHGDGHGSMQIHNHDAKQTLFALNNWRSGDRAELGIGNRPNDAPDWTFAGNAGSYRAKRLRILVHLR
jgi:sialate O-acetylesterase